jgi:hypothetical protein
MSSLSQLISCLGMVPTSLMLICEYLELVLLLYLTRINSVITRPTNAKAFPDWMKKNHPDVHAKFLNAMQGYCSYLWSLNEGKSHSSSFQIKH